MTSQPTGWGWFRWWLLGLFRRGEKRYVEKLKRQHKQIREDAIRDAAWAAHSWVVDHMSQLETMAPSEISDGIVIAIKTTKPRPTLTRALCAGYEDVAEMSQKRFT